MIIYGTRATGISQFAVPNVDCGHCQRQNTQQIAVFGRYAHVFWIPLFPIGKVAVAECSHCKRTVEKSEFTPDLKSRYDDRAKEIKRPVWHWAGLALILLLVGFGTISAALEKADPRYDLLQADLNRMTATPSEATDSVSFLLKLYLDNLVLQELQPEEFSYLTREESDRALILLQIPTLKQVDKEARTDFLEMVNEILIGFPHLEGKDHYIAVKGRSSIMLLRTPNGDVRNGSFIGLDDLYSFYGPAE